MHSGAGHDTQRMAKIARTAMVFVRSKDGRSHTPAEFTSVEDAVDGIRVLAAGPAEARATDGATGFARRAASCRRVRPACAARQFEQPASSITAPVMQSSSSGLPASRSWSIDVLWSPTAKPASSRRSSETGNSTRARRRPQRTPRRSRAAVRPSRAASPSSPSVARVSAVTGLKATLPISFSQIWSRSRASTGHLSPPADERLARSAGSARSRCRRARRSRSAFPRHGGSRPARRSPPSSRRRSRRRARGSIAPRSTPPGSTLSSTVAVERAADATGSTTRGCRSAPAITAAPRRERLAEAGRELRQAVGLQPDEHNVGVGDRAEVVGRLADATWKSPRGLSTRTPSLLHRAQVCAARDQRHVAASRASAAPT